MTTRKYRNRSGRSGVDTYNIGRGTITVGFKDGSFYTYNNSVTGKHAMGRMRTLAKKGRGLNGYINRSVAYSRYASKF